MTPEDWNALIKFFSLASLVSILIGCFVYDYLGKKKK